MECKIYSLVSNLAERAKKEKERNLSVANEVFANTHIIV